jgi:hypothetical protein
MAGPVDLQNHKEGQNEIRETNVCYVCGLPIEVGHSDGSPKWYWLSDASGLVTVPNSHPKVHLACHKIWQTVAREMLAGDLPP